MDPESPLGPPALRPLAKPRVGRHAAGKGHRADSRQVDRQGDVHDPLANYYRDGYHCPGNAGLFTTANDLAKFCRMLLSNGRFGDRQILKPETVDMFFTNQAPADPNYTWGLGWGLSHDRLPASVQPGPKTATISHTGYTGTFVDVDRYAGTYAIILTNRVYPNDDTSVGSIRSGIRQIIQETDPLYQKPPTSNSGK